MIFIFEYFVFANIKRRVNSRNTLVTCFNSGFGCGKRFFFLLDTLLWVANEIIKAHCGCENPVFVGNVQLTRQWLPDLQEILQDDLIVIHTCSNDYSDLRGELQVRFQLTII